ncbi:MAG: MFS transporter, partial [Anaerolineae bacterium]
PLNSYVTAARGDLEVGRALSVISSMFSFGMALGPVTGGWIAENYGMNTSYLVAFVVFVFSNLSLIFIQSQPLDVHDPSAPPQNLLKNTRFVNFLMIYAFVVFALYIAQPLTPNFLKGIRELTLTETGWIFSAGALGNSVMMLLLSRFQPRRGFIVAQFMVILFAVLIWQGAGLPIFMLGYFLLGGFRAARPMAMAQARELVHSSQMGISYGAMETVSSIIFIIAPPIAGFIFDRDPFMIYPLAIGLIIVSIFVSYFFAPRKIETSTANLQS